MKFTSFLLPEEIIRETTALFLHIRAIAAASWAISSLPVKLSNSPRAQSNASAAIAMHFAPPRARNDSILNFNWNYISALKKVFIFSIHSSNHFSVLAQSPIHSRYSPLSLPSLSWNHKQHDKITENETSQSYKKHVIGLHQESDLDMWIYWEYSTKRAIRNVTEFRDEKGNMRCSKRDCSVFVKGIRIFPAATSATAAYKILAHR